MNKSDPPQQQMDLSEVKSSEDTSSTEKQYKKIRTSPRADDDAPRLLDKPSSTTSLSTPTTTSSPTLISPRTTTNTTINNNSNNINNGNNTHPRHDNDTADEGLYHKKAKKEGKQKPKKDSQQPAWGARLRTHPKPVVRFGLATKDKGEKGSDGEEPEDSQDLPHERNPTPPSSPHPPDDIPLETLLKHGSGWVRTIFYTVSKFLLLLTLQIYFITPKKIHLHKGLHDTT